MGSCVPPRPCAGTAQSYLNPTNAALIGIAVEAVSRESTALISDQVWITGTGPTSALVPALNFALLDGLAMAYWGGSPPATSWTSTPEEDTRVFMLERLIAQSLSVQELASTPAQPKLEVSWNGASIFTEDFRSNATDSTTPLNGALDAEATDQISGFANYLYHAVKIELESKAGRVRPVIDLVGTCLEGIGNVVYVAKALTHLHRPAPPYSLPVPVISAWPGGHAYFSGAIATLLYVVLTKGLVSSPDVAARKHIAARLSKMAVRISENRERAALHFVEDSRVGLKWGFKVMEEVLTRARAAAVVAETAAASGTDVVPGTLSDLHTLILQVA